MRTSGPSPSTVPGPRPPQPISAPPNFSLGGVSPRPRTCRGTMLAAATPAAVPCEKSPASHASFRFVHRSTSHSAVTDFPTPLVRPRAAPSYARAETWPHEPLRPCTEALIVSLSISGGIPRQCVCHCWRLYVLTTRRKFATTANSANRSPARHCPALWHTSTDAGPATTPGSGTQEGLSRST